MEQKKCPFRKITYVADYHWEGNQPLPAAYQEDFQECIKTQCQAWFEIRNYGGMITNQGCRLMNK